MYHTPFFGAPGDFELLCKPERNPQSVGCAAIAEHQEPCLAKKSPLCLLCEEFQQDNNARDCMLLSGQKESFSGMNSTVDMWNTGHHNKAHKL
jgi:hypothetical protein